jgi:ketosteroid isomerase-like protein
VNPEDVVHELLARIQDRDWPGLRALLADDLVVEWPVTGETFRGADNFVDIQRYYPEGWSIHLLRIVSGGDQVAAEVEVPQEGIGVFRNAMFGTVENGLLVRATEYWTQPGSEPAPDWRSPFRDPSD